MASPHDGHRQRMRNRFSAGGFESFSPHEVLEYLLYFTIPYGDTNETAHRLIAHFGSLSGVLEAGFEELCAVQGVGPKSARLLSCIPELTRAYCADLQSKGTVLDTPQRMREYLAPLFLGVKEEQFYAVCLDGKRRVLHCSRLNEGTIDRVHVDMRAMMELVLRVGATGLILAHNHPVQFAVPSNDDVVVTRYIASVLRSVSVKLVDHWIFSRDDCISMRKSGYFAQIDSPRAETD